MQVNDALTYMYYVHVTVFTIKTLHAFLKYKVRWI